MALLDLIQHRKSVREFLDIPVEREKIMTCLEAARLAPSESNSQPWRFIIVDDKELRIKDNETGFLVEKANPAKLASKIIYCMKNPERLEIVAHNAFLICQNKFNFKNQSIELKRIYDSLIE